jgi:hypothetical protein
MISSSSSSIILLLDVYDLSLITISGKGHFLIMNMLTLKKYVLWSFNALLSLNKRERKNIINSKTKID